MAAGTLNWMCRGGIVTGGGAERFVVALPLISNSIAVTNCRLAESILWSVQEACVVSCVDSAFPCERWRSRFLAVYPLVGLAVVLFVTELLPYGQTVGG